MKRRVCEKKPPETTQPKKNPNKLIEAETAETGTVRKVCLNNKDTLLLQRCFLIY